MQGGQSGTGAEAWSKSSEVIHRRQEVKSVKQARVRARTEAKTKKKIKRSNKM